MKSMDYYKGNGILFIKPRLERSSGCRNTLQIRKKTKKQKPPILEAPYLLFFFVIFSVIEISRFGRRKAERGDHR